MSFVCSMVCSYLGLGGGNYRDLIIQCLPHSFDEVGLLGDILRISYKLRAKLSSLFALISGTAVQSTTNIVLQNTIECNPL